MLKYDQQAPSKFWLYILIISCTAGVVYLFWKIHWVAGVVAIPVCFLLDDVIINRQRSITWYLFDFLRYTLTLGGTAVIASYLWKINWIIGAISILPVFFLLLNIIGFLTLPIYAIIPAACAAKNTRKSLEKFNRDLEMSEGESSGLIAGLSFPLEYIAGYYMRLHTFTPLADLVLDSVGPPGLMGAYGLANVELPNPDVEPNQRIFTLPIKNKSDYKSLSRAHLDSGVKAGTNELVLLYEHRRGLLGGRKPSLHVAAYPAGTWSSFFEAVSRYAADQFLWPVALFLYQPSGTQAFPARGNLFSA